MQLGRILSRHRLIPDRGGTLQTYLDPSILIKVRPVVDIVTMTPYRQIRANFHGDTIVVYQAYSPSIAGPAIAADKFVTPFSFDRMTWIKPSFLWMMERSNWGRKSNQECILAVRITRTGWEEALTSAVLTHPDESVYSDIDDWRRRTSEALVQVQWDPERSIRGGKLEYRAIQVGLSRHIVRRYVDEWIVGIEDVTPRVRKMASMIASGDVDKAKALLPRERPYPLHDDIARTIGAS
jgi:hypothetical protein